MWKNTGYANPLRKPFVIIFENYNSRSSNVNFHRVCKLKVHLANQVLKTPLCENPILQKFHFAKIPFCENSILRKSHFTKIPLYENSILRKFYFMKIPLCEQSTPLIFLYKKKKYIFFFIAYIPTSFLTSLVIFAPFCETFAWLWKICLKRYHLLRLFSLAIETLRTMFILIGGRVEEVSIVNIARIFCSWLPLV